jgi:hypothetical protein
VEQRKEYSHFVGAAVSVDPKRALAIAMNDALKIQESTPGLLRVLFALFNFLTIID